MKNVTGFLKQISRLTIERNTAAKRDLSIEVLKDSIENGLGAGQRLHSTSSLAHAVRTGDGIIAEIKRASPSQGLIAAGIQAPCVAQEYLENGASAISVLTEPTHFGGSMRDLQDVRAAHPSAVLLMKDFVIDPYQIYQARYFGADAVLLIIALLNQNEVLERYKLATQLGLSVLVEVHNQSEFDEAVSLECPIIGINNRDLETLQTDLSIAKRLVQSRPTEALLVAESGIENQQTIQELRALGFEGFLVGTSLMRAGTPGLSLSQLVRG